MDYVYCDEAKCPSCSAGLDRLTVIGNSRYTCGCGCEFEWYSENSVFTVIAGNPSIVPPHRVIHYPVVDSSPHYIIMIWVAIVSYALGVFTAMLMAS